MKYIDCLNEREHIKGLVNQYFKGARHNMPIKVILKK